MAHKSFSDYVYDRDYELRESYADTQQSQQMPQSPQAPQARYNAMPRRGGMYGGDRQALEQMLRKNQVFGYENWLDALAAEQGQIMKTGNMSPQLQMLIRRSNNMPDHVISVIQGRGQQSMNQAGYNWAHGNEAR